MVVGGPLRLGPGSGCEITFLVHFAEHLFLVGLLGVGDQVPADRVFLVVVIVPCDLLGDRVRDGFDSFGSHGDDGVGGADGPLVFVAALGLPVLRALAFAVPAVGSVVLENLGVDDDAEGGRLVAGDGFRVVGGVWLLPVADDGLALFAACPVESAMVVVVGSVGEEAGVAAVVCAAGGGGFAFHRVSPEWFDCPR